MFEYHRQPYVKKVLTKDKWEEAKRAGTDWDFNCLPMVTYTSKEGGNFQLNQTISILRFFGVRYGYYNPNDWQTCRFVDPIIETWNDFMTAYSKALNYPSDAGREIVISALTNSFCAHFHQLCEQNLAFHKGKFIAGSEVTIADFALASYVANVLTNSESRLSEPCMRIIDSTPLFKVYTKTILTECHRHLSTRPKPGPF